MSEFVSEHGGIIIDEEFRRLLPPLDEFEYCSLEDNILVYGCMNPLVLWNNILIDGHNRYSIVTKHNLPFNTVSLEFNSRDEVISWMIKTQIYRRNLTPMQLTYYRGLQYNIEKKIHGGDRQSDDFSSGQNVHLNGSTANRLSEQYKVTARTIRRDGQIAEVLVAIGKESQEAKNRILTGDTRINRKQLREMVSASEEEIMTTAKEIASGTFNEKDNPSKPNEQDQTNPKGHPVTASIINGANEFAKSIRNLTPNNDPNNLKATIRAYIDDLETIYNQI